MKYTFYWLDGKRDVLEGNTPEEALNNSGYGAGAIPALDFHAKDDNSEYEWSKVKHKWKTKGL